MRPEAGPVGPVGPLDEGARRRRIRTMVIAGVGAVIIGVGGFFAIDAAVHHSQRVAAPGPVTRRPTGGGFGAGFRRGGTAGTISAINGTNLTLTTPAGATVKVVASSTTPVTKTAPGSVSSIAQGDTVTVIGTSSGTSIDASRILDAGTGTLAAVPALPGFGRVGPAGFGVTSGKVTGIDGGTLIVTEPGGTTATVTTSSSTTVTTQQQLSVSALTTGETIRVAGTTNSDGSITATAIQEGGPGGFRGGPPVGPPA